MFLEILSIYIDLCRYRLMINQSLTKQKYSFDVRAGTTNQDEPITSIDYTVIAYDLDQVIEWCKTEYNMSKMDEITSDELGIFFEYSYYGQISDHGNINEVKDYSEYIDEDGQIKEEYQEEICEARDTVEINGSELSESDYKYMIDGNYWNTVVDLTKEDN